NKCKNYLVVITESADRNAFPIFLLKNRLLLFINPYSFIFFISKPAVMKTKSILFFFAFVLCSNINTANAQVNKQDSLALVDLYNSTDGANWNDHTNWLTSKPVLKWYGITVADS